MAEPITTTIILVSVTLFSVGIVIGYLVSRESDATTRARLRTMIAIVVTLGWISATVAGILITSYTVSPLLHGLMGAVVGYFFTEDGYTFNIGGNK
jgi:hypothetical protein